MENAGLQTEFQFPTVAKKQAMRRTSCRTLFIEVPRLVES
jgi:hypothetical protein